MPPIVEVGRRSLSPETILTPRFLELLGQPPTTYDALPPPSPPPPPPELAVLKGRLAAAEEVVASLEAKNGSLEAALAETRAQLQQEKLGGEQLLEARDVQLQEG